MGFVCVERSCYLVCTLWFLLVVLIFSYLFGGKSYGASKCVTVFLIVSGVTIFMYKEVGSLLCVCLSTLYEPLRNIVRHFLPVNRARFVK